jgi:hypothetical protein
LRISTGFAIRNCIVGGVGHCKSLSYGFGDCWMPCHSHTWASRGEGLCDPRSRMFWEMLWVLCHLQTHQACAPTYILENVPLLDDTRFHVMANVHEIRSWIRPTVLLDVTRVGLCAH